MWLSLSQLVPWLSFLRVMITIFESRSTIIFLYPIVVAMIKPLHAHANFDSLFLVFPRWSTYINPVSYLWSLNNLPNPTGPQFPFETPSKLILMKPSGGVVKVWSDSTHPEISCQESGAIMVSANLRRLRILASWGLTCQYSSDHFSATIVSHIFWKSLPKLALGSNLYS